MRLLRREVIVPERRPSRWPVALCVLVVTSGAGLMLRDMEHQQRADAAAWIDRTTAEINRLIEARHRETQALRSATTDVAKAAAKARLGEIDKRLDVGLVRDGFRGPNEPLFRSK